PARPRFLSPGGAALPPPREPRLAAGAPFAGRFRVPGLRVPSAPLPLPHRSSLREIRPEEAADPDALQAGFLIDCASSNTAKRQGILSTITASRMKPYAQNPAAAIGNDTVFENGSKRLATQYVLTSPSWVSESRFGWNRNWSKHHCS